MSTRRSRALEDISNIEVAPPPKRQRKSLQRSANPDESVLQEVNLRIDQSDAASSSRSSSSGRRSTDTQNAVETLPPVPVVAIPPVAPIQIEPIAPPVAVVRRVVRDRTVDPALCLDLIELMHERWKEMEIQFSPTHYMADQRDITYRMRGILVDWLVEVHYKFKLNFSSLWLTINLLDRYLQKAQIARDKLQLVGVAALLIATKFDEVSPPEVNDCVHITDNSYSRRELLQMEYKIFETLGFQVSVPTGYNFISHYLGLIHADDILSYTALFYAERSLQEQHFLSVLPTHFAAAAVLAALWRKKSETHDSLAEAPISASAIWPAVLVEASGFTGEALMPCARNLILHAGQEPVTTSLRRLIAAKKKFTQEKYCNVAALPLPVLS